MTTCFISMSTFIIWMEKQYVKIVFSYERHHFISINRQLRCCCKALTGENPFEKDVPWFSLWPVRNLRAESLLIVGRGRLRYQLKMLNQLAMTCFFKLVYFLGGWSMQGGSPTLTSHLTELDNWKSLLQA